MNRTDPSADVYSELYSPDVVSVENWDTRQEYVGMAALRAKLTEWEASVEAIHSVSVSDPLVADQSFAVTFTMDITYKQMGRSQMTELAVYTVKDGKIVREEFRA
jgi:hypothetical protein